MPKLRSVEDLHNLRDRARKDLWIRTGTETRFVVGMGASGIAAGARETVRALVDELHRRDFHAHVAIADGLGVPDREPVVRIEQGGEPPVTYGNIHPDRVSRLIEEHLVGGRVIQEWLLDQALAPKG
jgi:NADP-reducing hydrogenase subunit HndB